jgi:cytochrome P450/NADPH-cytochrome P450 reductase
MRGCIGRPFAWQEALLTTCLLLQNFNFRMNDPSYELSIMQTLTVKPKGFFMHATLRENIDTVHLEKMLHIDPSKEGHVSERDRRLSSSAPSSKPSKPMTILYGSNSGTCEALAQTLARNAASYGFQAEVNPLDSAVGSVPKGRPIVLISPSYEGQPPDNAAHFVEWLAGMTGDELRDVKYAVYGCGNHDWASTFHKVPKGLDASFEEHGATRVAEMGLGDVAAGDVFNDFDKWQDELLWPAIGGGPEDANKESGIDVVIDTTTRTSQLRQDVREAVVVSNEVLTAEGEPEKRHIALKLPTGASYKVGDYLAVLPLNHSKTIRRVLKRYGLPWDSMLTIKSGANTTLPMGIPISAYDILGAYVELSQPATKKVYIPISHVFS